MRFDLVNINEIIKVSLILFSIIDMPGSVPVIISLQKRAGDLHAGRATLVSGLVMIAFLFFGELILRYLGLDVVSFSLAGAVIIFLIGMEMILGIHIFRDTVDSKVTSIVPLAFPLIAGTGTMTTIISLQSQYKQINILIGILLNLVLVYFTISQTKWLDRKLGKAGVDVLRKIFGVILLAISMKMFKDGLLKTIIEFRPQIFP